MANIVNRFGYHTISFDTQGGYPVKPIHKRRSQLVIMPKAERPGYVFGGWFFDKECTRPALISTMPRENVKVYARWNVILPFTAEDEKKPQFFLPAEATSVPHPKSFLKQLKEGANVNKDTYTNLCAYLLGHRGGRLAALRCGGGRGHRPSGPGGFRLSRSGGRGLGSGGSGAGIDRLCLGGLGFCLGLGGQQIGVPIVGFGGGLFCLLGIGCGAFRQQLLNIGGFLALLIEFSLIHDEPP